MVEAIMQYAENWLNVQRIIEEPGRELQRFEVFITVSDCFCKQDKFMQYI